MTELYWHGLCEKFDLPEPWEYYIAIVASYAATCKLYNPALICYLTCVAMYVCI